MSGQLEDPNEGQYCDVRLADILVVQSTSQDSRAMIESGQ
jgi:hypothetical protein